MHNAAMVPELEVSNNLETARRINEINAGRSLNYHIEAYGCQMNAHDAETMAGYFEMMGYAKAESKETADLIVFNTCCVREHAEKRVFGNIGALKKLKEEKPGLHIIVCGCMTQQIEVAQKMFRRFPFVDMIIGTNELHMLPSLFEKVIHGERVFVVRNIEGEVAEGMPISREGSFSTCVNIMYGCNNFCTYCIVPYVRGRERSRSAQSVLLEVKQAVSQGFKEVMLLGQNVNSYKGNDGEIDFPKLLSMVNDVEGLERIRFMTSHPKDLSPRLIDAFAELPKLCRHIHLPVQSGSDKILKDMNRHYTREQYLSTVKELRRKAPDIEITTDIIVGFPGESEEDFEDTLSIMREVGFAAAYTFMYSKRTGTKAAVMEGQIDEETKRDRLARLNEQQAELLRGGNRKYLGTEGFVLVEGCDYRDAMETMAYGKLMNNKMVYFPGEESLTGKLVKVRITDIQNNSLIGVSV